MEYDYPIGKINATKFAKLWRIPGPFGSNQTDIHDLHDAFIRMTFQMPTALNTIRTFRPWILEMNFACERCLK